MMNLQEKKTFKVGVRWLALSGALAVLSTGGWLIYAQTFNRAAQPVAVRLLTVKRGNVELVINESGTVELGGQQQLKSPGEVTVDRVLVKVGDPIRFGQKLLILRNQQRQTSLDNQELEIRKQKLKLTRSRQKIDEAQEKLAAAQKELKEPVNQQFLIRKQELVLERSRQKVEEAKEKLAAAQQKLQQLEVLDRKGFIPGNELQEQKEQVRNAEFAVRDAQTTVNTDSSELKRLQVERESIQQQLQNNIVIAPIAGKVLDVKVKDGDGLKPGDVLLTLGNPAQELVTLQLSTLDATKVRVNQKARIKVIGPQATPYRGQVKSLYPGAIAQEDNQGSSRRQSTQAKVPAIVQLDEPTGNLIPGSQVSVEIIQEQRQNVLTVDLSAIERSESKAFVWLRDDYGKAQKRPVTLGLEGTTNVEVRAGLRLGDQVILPPPETFLQPGTPVVPQSNPPSDTISSPNS